MAQKISATSLRLGTTQLWKFETNPNYYSDSNAGYVFLYCYVKHELKKQKIFLVDAQKQNKKIHNTLNLAVFIPAPIQAKKRRTRKLKTLKTRKYNTRPFKYKRKRKYKKKRKIRLVVRLKAPLAPVRKYPRKKLARIFRKLRNTLIFNTGASRACRTFSYFQLKQKSLKRKVYCYNYRTVKKLFRLRLKRRRVNLKRVKKFLKLKKLAYNLEFKIQKFFKQTWIINLRDARELIKRRSKKQLARLKNKLRYSMRRFYLLDEVAEITNIAFDLKSASFLTEYIADKITTEKRINYFIRFLLIILKTGFDIKKNLKALKIEIWGKRFKSGRTKKTQLICGSLKLSSIKYAAYENVVHAFTRFGTFGLRTILIKK